MMNVKAMYGAKLAELRKKYRNKDEPLVKNAFFLFENMEKNALLFIGINPGEVKDSGQKGGITNEDGIYWGKEEFKSEYPFYQHFNDLACGMKWSHLDLFFSCEKNQESLKKITKTSEFIKEQFAISKEIIQKLAPKIIVVGNAYASHLIRENFDCKFDDEIGTYRVKEYNNVPIFFSGMFTGKRALDIGSRERLAWHIRHC